MDRRIAYPGSLPQSLDINAPQQNAMTAIGWAMQAVMGASAWAAGFVCTATSSPSMSLVFGSGAIGQMSVVESAPLSTDLPADTTDPLMKVGINVSAQSIAFTAPGTAGQSQCFVVQGQMQEADTTPVVLPYYNAATPAIPFAGVGNSLVAQNTLRTQRATLQVVSGTPTTTGSQVAPAVTGGWVGLYIVTIANGTTTLTPGANVVTHPAAPFARVFLPAASGVPGPRYAQNTAGTYAWVCPPGVYSILCRITGPGGAGSAGNGTTIANGGGGGGFIEFPFTVTPGASYPLVVAAGGVGNPTTAFGFAAGCGGTANVSTPGAGGAVTTVGGLPCSAFVGGGGGYGSMVSGALYGGTGGSSYRGYGINGTPNGVAGTTTNGINGGTGQGGTGGPNGAGGTGGSGFLEISY